MDPSQAMVLSSLNSQAIVPIQNQASFNASLNGNALALPVTQLPSDQINQNQQSPAPRLMRQYEDPGFMVSSMNAPDGGKNSNQPKIKNPGEIVAKATLVVDGLFLGAMIALFFALSLGRRRGRPSQDVYSHLPDSTFQKTQLKNEREEYDKAAQLCSAQSSVKQSNIKNHPSRKNTTRSAHGAAHV